MKNHLGKITLGTPDRDSNLNLPVIGSLVYCESDALDHAATEADPCIITYAIVYTASYYPFGDPKYTSGTHARTQEEVRNFPGVGDLGRFTYHTISGPASLISRIPRKKERERTITAEEGKQLLNTRN
uniref:Uncharacterized protein n=1 Tax=Timema poppense TaxID=170557 RepID=A0A7R9CHY6_TIMPO|nr:unnamed protein product [Timema poppensis]